MYKKVNFVHLVKDSHAECIIFQYDNIFNSRVAVS